MEENNQLAVITNEVSVVTKKISSIKGEITDAISDNNKSLRACISTGELLLSRTNDGMNDELDADIASFIKKGRATIKAMSDRRKRVTQVFDLVKKGFTTMEGFLDPKDEASILYKLQKKRDDYAAWKLEQQRKAEEERQRQVRIAAQREQVVADMRKLCSDVLTVVSQEKVAELNKIFADINLQNKDWQKSQIADFPSTLKLSSILHHSECASYERTPLQILVDNFLDAPYPDLTENDVKTVRNDTFLSCHADSERQFTDTITQVKTELLDRFASKIAELEEAERQAEKARRKAEEAKKLADEEARRKAEEEAKRMEEERKRREEEMRKADEEAARLKAEQLKAEAEARAQQEKLEAAKAQANTLFNEATSISTPVKAKVTQHIEIDAPEAFLDIIQLWWAIDGCTMTVEELSKKLSFMVKTCEKQANKEQNYIKNPSIRYVEDIKAK